MIHHSSVERCNYSVNMTLNLLQILESSDNLAIETLTEDEAKQLYELSAKNRIKTNFLEKFACTDKFPDLRRLSDREQTAYLEMLSAVHRISKRLADANISHAVFKTIRPYRSTTVDIDTIIFGNENEYWKALGIMKGGNYPMLAYGPMSATFWDPQADLGIDLYNEIAVSALCYMDKDQLMGFSKTTALPNGENANLMKPEADLLTIVAHSIIKEQMYTLSEYYSFVKYLEKIDTNEFVDLVSKTNLKNPAKTHTSITALLFRATYGKTSKKLQDILEAIGRDDFELSRIVKNDLQTPHKYHPLTLGKALLEIAKGKKSRVSFALQIYSMASPRFTSKFLRATLQHMVRETY
jgi:hypothetical protein